MSVTKNLVDKFRSNPTAGTMRELVNQVRTSHSTDEEIAHLAEILGRSGSIISIQDGRCIADLASTGAPTSLSTLLGPLFLCAMGLAVPKLGIPGRPAGGIDVMAQLRGYRVRLSSQEVISCIQRCGYVHFLSDSQHAPLDARLFRFRQMSGAQNIPELAVASLLSKKIAVGLRRVGLDIRVAPHGNFGSNWEDARRNGECFQRVASVIGINATCFLTDARFPYQPFVGRSESLVALEEVFSGMPRESLRHHAMLCLAMACGIANESNVDLRAKVAAAEKHFYNNLLAQGSSREAFEELVYRTRRGHRFQVIAKNSGFFCVRIERLRELMLAYQETCVRPDSIFPDGMGIILKKRPGELVESGNLVATVRVDEGQWRSAERDLRDAILISNTLQLAQGFERI